MAQAEDDVREDVRTFMRGLGLSTASENSSMRHDSTARKKKNKHRGKDFDFSSVKKQKPDSAGENKGTSQMGRTRVTRKLKQESSKKVQKRKKRKEEEKVGAGKKATEQHFQGQGGNDDENLRPGGVLDKPDGSQAAALSLWYEDTAAKPMPVSLHSPSAKRRHREKHAEAEAQLRLRVAQLMERVVPAFEAQKAQLEPADHQWLQHVLKNGTLHDRVVAMAAMVQESPLHRLETLDKLLHMAARRGHREADMSLSTLKDLFLDSLLPPHRKLRALSEQPIARAMAASDKQVLFWWLEDQLKGRYRRLVQVLEEAGHSQMEHVKSAALGMAHELLAGRPEQEEALLALLANKLGDPIKKIASKAAYCLQQLLQQHPAMKGPVVSELEGLLFRPNVSARTRYYALIFLNQLIFSPQDSALALQLLKVYFALFRTLAGKTTQPNTQTSPDKTPKVSKKKAKLMLKLAKRKRQQKKKADKGASEAEGDVSAEQAGLHGKLLSALLTGVNRAFPFAPSDQTETLYLAELDSLYRVAADESSSWAISVQAMQLIYQISFARGEVPARFYRALYQKLWAQGLLVASKPALFLNLLYKVMKRDPSLPRAAAFAKRLLQLCTLLRASLVCAVLYLISEVFRVQPTLHSLMTSTADSPPGPTLQGLSSRTISTSSPPAEEQEQEHAHAYDPWKREPLHCGAQYSCLWELGVLCAHFHPSVAKFAQTIAKGDHIQYKGDPLTDFTRQAFLDRFVYKNPKGKPTRPGGGQRLSRKAATRGQTGRQALLVNTEEFREMAQEQLPEDQVFFHKYFKQKALQDQKKGGDELGDQDEEGLEEAADRIIEKEIERMGEMGGDDPDFSDLSELSSDRGARQDDQDEDGEEIGRIGQENKEEEEEEEDDAAEEAAAFREMMGGDEQEQGSGEESSELSLDEEEDGDEGGDEDGGKEIEESETASAGKKRSKKKSPFASAEEVAELLQQAGKSKPDKLAKWKGAGRGVVQGGSEHSGRPRREQDRRSGGFRGKGHGGGGRSGTARGGKRGSRGKRRRNN
eukprot:g63502.t1